MVIILKTLSPPVGNCVLKIFLQAVISSWSSKLSVISKYKLRRVEVVRFIMDLWLISMIGVHQTVTFIRTSPWEDGSCVLYHKSGDYYRHLELKITENFEKNQLRRVEVRHFIIIYWYISIHGPQKSAIIINNTISGARELCILYHSTVSNHQLELKTPDNFENIGSGVRNPVVLLCIFMMISVFGGQKLVIIVKIPSPEGGSCVF